MSVEQFRVRLSGERPLLMHSSRLADPLDPITIELDRLTRKRDKTIADHEQIGRVEWHGGLWLRDGKPCIPGEAIESAFVAASRTRRKGKQAMAGFSCSVSPLLEYDGPTDLDSLWENKAFRFRFPVTVNDSKVMRTRVRFPSVERDHRGRVSAEPSQSKRSRGDLRDRGLPRGPGRLASQIRKVFREAT
jgi:hypothetical protein